MPEEIEKLAEKVGAELKQRGWKLATAESCTGGGVSYWITSIAGSSDWFDRGFVTYSNTAKSEMLHVPQNLLNNFGSVSEPTARSMAEGALKRSDADVTVAITGIAGPGGGSKEKPVGTVWIACAGKIKETQTFVNMFSGTRRAVRDQSIVAALRYILEFIDYQATKG